MSIDINNPKFGEIFDDPSDPEAHMEPAHSGVLTFVKGYEHPLFTANGAVNLINTAIGLSNTSEQKRKAANIPTQVFRDIARAARSSRISYDLLLFVADWERGIDSRQSADDVKDLATKLYGYVNDLRSSLGRDPLYGEIFMAHVLKSADKVKQFMELAEQKPNEDVANTGSSKPDITDKKMRNGKAIKRTNREFYDYFLRRIPNGRRSFTEILGKEK